MSPIDLGFESFVFFLLIFARLMGVFVQAPLFGRPQGIPMPAQICYGLGISFLIFHTLPLPPHLPTGLMETAIDAAGQAAIGLMIGFTSYLVVAGVQFAGEMCDIQMGLSIAAMVNPATGQPINLIASFEQKLGILSWLFIRGYVFFFRAIKRSYQLIPVYGFTINGPALTKLIQSSGSIFSMALEISAPVLVALFITQIALGLLNRAAQQFNVFMISFPLNILVGLSLLLLSIVPMFYLAIPHLWRHMDKNIASLIMDLRRR
jgi:flagellar biosynthetic protein FliR